MPAYVVVLRSDRDPVDTPGGGAATAPRRRGDDGRRGVRGRPFAERWIRGGCSSPPGSAPSSTPLWSCRGTGGRPQWRSLVGCGAGHRAHLGPAAAWCGPAMTLEAAPAGAAPSHAGRGGHRVACSAWLAGARPPGRSSGRGRPSARVRRRRPQEDLHVPVALIVRVAVSSLALLLPTSALAPVTAGSPEPG